MDAGQGKLCHMLRGRDQRCGNSQLREDSKQLIAIDLQPACRILLGTCCGTYKAIGTCENIVTNYIQCTNAADSNLL